MLNDEELLRYSRQILLQHVDIAGQLRLKNSKVLIVGLGGLGSPVALYLAAAGVGELYLADFDRLDLSNLQRQIVHDSTALGALKVQSAQARLQALNPQIAVHTVSDKLDQDNLPALLQSVDLVLDCTDNFTIRGQLNAACFAAGTVLISGAAIRTAVIFFYLSNEGLSILENSAVIGIPIPEKLKDMLIQLTNEKHIPEKDDEKEG